MFLWNLSQLLITVPVYWSWCCSLLFGQLKAAKLEIRDLQSEFELERDDYLATIRRLERESQLLQGLLERMVPLVRRDCNYSNLERLRREAAWDEESATWRLPEVLVQKTALPAGVRDWSEGRIIVAVSF